jgi:phosphatidate phosphatase APP1
MTVTRDPVTLQPRSPNHRGRDLFVNPGDPQWVIAQFAYGALDVDLDDEFVDIYAQRDCASGWEPLGTAITTKGAEPHATVEGVSDHGGRVYFEIPANKRFGPGRHRVRLVVRGDQSWTDLFIDVVPRGTPMFISDVDGTLTSSEHIEYAALLLGVQPATHAGAPEALRALAAKGYRAMYLTARPEPLVGRTREFLERHGFPPGIVHTSTSLIGAPGQGGAAAFKSREIAMLAERQLVPVYAFGNKTTDSEAYATINPKSNAFFYQIEGAFEGRRIESYTELLPGFAGVAPVCRK